MSLVSQRRGGRTLPALEQASSRGVRPPLLTVENLWLLQQEFGGLPPPDFFGVSVGGPPPPTLKIYSLSRLARLLVYQCSGPEWFELEERLASEAQARAARGTPKTECLHFAHLVQTHEAAFAAAAAEDDDGLTAVPPASAHAHLEGLRARQAARRAASVWGRVASTAAELLFMHTAGPAWAAWMRRRPCLLNAAGGLWTFGHGPLAHNQM